MPADDATWPPPPVSADAGTEIRVPLNVPRFRNYRDWQAMTARLGMMMALFFCGVAVFALYEMVVDRSHLGGWALLLCLALCLVGFIGAATWPAWQTAKTLTQTLTQNLPALVVNSEGIYDHSSDNVFGFIPWKEIAYVCAASRRARELSRDFPGVAFVVKNPGLLLQRKPSLMRWYISWDGEVTDQRRIFIPQGRLAVSVDDVVQQIKTFQADFRLGPWSRRTQTTDTSSSGEERQA